MTKRPNSSAARRLDGASMPPTTRAFQTASAMMLPGSTRSGQWASSRSAPTLRPERSRIGATTCSVASGGIVDSTTTRLPRRRTGRIDSVAATTARRSGALVA